jgi:hypothetical protein
MKTNTLTTEQLLRLGTMFANHQIAGLMGSADEAQTGRGVIAGIVATLHEVLPPARFHSVMIQWEIDDIKLSELLELAKAQPETSIEA